MDQFLLVLSIVWLAVISPGADFAMVSRVSFVDGRQAGILAALGIAIACWFHVLYAIFGLAMVREFFPHLLEVIKLAGAAYLIYLGLGMMRSKPASPQPLASTGARTLAIGILTNGLNPKTSIFVISLYAQIIGPQTALPLQLGYGALISLSHLLWFSAVAVFLSQPLFRAWILARQQVVNAAIGGVLILLGAALALSNLAMPT